MWRIWFFIRASPIWMVVVVVCICVLGRGDGEQGDGGVWLTPVPVQVVGKIIFRTLIVKFSHLIKELIVFISTKI